jgi:hypothetical protein
VAAPALAAAGFSASVAIETALPGATAAVTDFFAGFGPTLTPTFGGVLGGVVSQCTDGSCQQDQILHLQNPQQ